MYLLPPFVQGVSSEDVSNRVTEWVGGGRILREWRVGGLCKCRRGETIDIYIQETAHCVGSKFRQQGRISLLEQGKQHPKLLILLSKEGGGGAVFVLPILRVADFCK